MILGACQTQYVVKYFRIECGDFDFIRQRFFNAKNVKGLYENVDMDVILFVLKEIELHQTF